MKTILLLSLSFMLSVQAFSHSIHIDVQESQQNNTQQIKGTVVDKEGVPLIGASIAVKNQTQKTTTDIDGHFVLNTPLQSTLIVSYMGFTTKEVVAKKSNINIVLVEDSKLLSEVTVTALGIKREKKALGYAVGEVKGDELEKAKEINVINSLAGKVAGLTVSQTAGGPSGSSRVIIRGSTEMTGNNQPLYVVDGVPLDNSSYGNAGTYGGYDLGDGISSINPDDIENISVLKGPAASALYGSRASHGVILITTKKANKNKALGVELNSTTTIDQQLTKWNNIQYDYGQGTEGRILGTDDRHSSNKNWGPKIDPGLNLSYFDGVTRPYKIIPNNMDGFFRTGVTTSNTVVLNKIQDETGIRVSYTDMRNSDIVPNTHMSRNSINIRANTTFAKKLDLDVKANYVREDVKNRPALGDDRANPARNLITLATTFDQAWLKNSYKDADGNYLDWNNRDVYNINPYWIINEMNNTSGKDRYIGSALLRYRINKEIQVQVTGGADINNFEFLEYAPPSTPGYETGFLQTRNFNNRTWNVEFLASYNKTFKEKFGLGATLGGNLFRVDNKTQAVTGKEMQSRDVVALQSFASKEIEYFNYAKQINSVFGMLNLSYNGFLFMDATIRQDKSSTLPSQNNTYVYPSVSGSFLFTEAFNINKKILSYGKIRASWAQVGSDTDPYQLELTYALSKKAYNGFALGEINNSVIPNRNLKPTKSNSKEFGFDLKFFNNRMGIDFTYYAQTSKNQIMRVNTTIASGYNAMLINAGQINNNGIEIALNTRVIETKDFSWDLNFNFSKNNNKVIKLAEGINEFELESARWLDVKVAAVEGQNFGSILGRDFLRNDAGAIIIDGATGLPKVTDDLKVLGNATWDWTGGINTNIRYKNLSLSAIFDVKVGADIFSMSSRSLYLTGKDKATLTGRDAWYKSEEERLQAGQLPAQWDATGGYVADGVVEVTDGAGNVTYEKNTKAIDPEKYWMHIADKTPVPFIYDNSYVKVREITLSYNLPKSFIGKVVDACSVSFVARNPFIIYKNVPNIDPDSNYNNGSGMGLEYGSLPSRRSYGLNLNVKF